MAIEIKNHAHAMYLVKGASTCVVCGKGEPIGDVDFATMSTCTGPQGQA